MNMKKYLILSFVFFPLITSASFDSDLYYGLRKNPQVQELQEFLTDQGLYSGPITGNFFALTLKAIKSFQTVQSITPTGYFGPITRGKANAMLASAGITPQGVMNESGTTTNPAITMPKTNDDVVAKLTEQIKLLQDQLTQLQKNQDTLQSIQTQQQAQTSTLEAIQQNTTPPLPAPTPVPSPLVKNLVITANKTLVQLTIWNSVDITAVYT